jgi:hypothetical protein
MPINKYEDNYDWVAGPQGATGSTYTVNTGAVGSASHYSITPGNATYTIPSYYTTTNAIWTSNIVQQHDITITVQNQTIEVGKTLKMLMDRLCVIEPNFKLIEKYPALREAYEHYKMMEALLANEDNSQEEK